MREENFYFINEDELMKINDLIECLGLAVDKMIRGRRLIRECHPDHPAVDGFKQMIHDVLTEDNQEPDPMNIF